MRKKIYVTNLELALLTFKINLGDYVKHFISFTPATWKSFFRGVYFSCKQYSWKNDLQGTK